MSAWLRLSSRVYQITLTVGKQLKADGKEINFKFFGQPDWGIEFKGTAADFPSLDYRAVLSLLSATAKRNTRAARTMVTSISARA
jgi:hypothetical protein